MRALAVASIAIVAVVLLASSVVVLTSGHNAQGSVLTMFGSEDELRGYLKDRCGPALDLINGLAYSAESSRSGTNLQVRGVDEGDTIKTDGSTLFIAEGGTVHVVAVAPSLHNLTDITVGAPDRHCIVIHCLYLLDGRLVVVYSQYEMVDGRYPALDSEMFICCPWWSAQWTGVAVYDVHDPADPSMVLDGGISGGVVTTRMIGEVLYIVSEQMVWSGADLRLPEITSQGTTEKVEATAIGYDPSCTEISCFVNLLAYDTSSGQVGSFFALAGPSSVVYMSGTALYLTMARWSAGGWPLSTSASRPTTEIYRIAMEGTELTMTAQGTVAGTVLGQFSLDEQDGRLRVATTSSGPSSSVYLLDLDLDQVGELNGIAPGETIYSCRFQGDRLYLVTFRQVDPLFVIDLSADRPRLMGELKMPGVSTYLQMVEHGLLGIGFENGSVKVSLYNITDPENPSEIGSYVFSGISYSSAQYDHHAVLYDPRYDLLVMPVTRYDTLLDAWGYPTYRSSAVVLSIGEDGVTEVGEVVHHNSTVERSLYIGDVLYTISDTTVKASALPSISPLGELVYADGPRYWYC